MENFQEKAFCFLQKSRTIIWNGFVASLEGSMDDIGNEARKVAVQSHVGVSSWMAY